MIMFYTIRTTYRPLIEIFANFNKPSNLYLNIRPFVEIFARLKTTSPIDGNIHPFVENTQSTYFQHFCEYTEYIHSEMVPGWSGMSKNTQYIRRAAVLLK